MAVAVIVGFRNGKISHQHIYWDQASVLVQIGAEVAQKVVNPKLPSRRF
jgi:carboxymethylenebutenolidase